MPLGILYLSSYIKKHNKLGATGMLDYAPEVDKIAKYKDIENFILKIAERDADFIPDVLAFSLVFSTSYRFFTVAVGLLKSLWPKATVIVGGTHATNCTKMLLENDNVDFVARGEGEIALSEFLKQLSGLSAIRVKGIYSRENISDAPLYSCDFVTNIDELPFPDWDLVDMEMYKAERGRRRSIGSATESRMASLMTTRGCVFKCTFCSSHTVHGRKMRYRSVENVVEEIRLLHDRYGVTLFIPEDDLFTANRKRVISLLYALRDLNITDFELQFPNALSIATLDKGVMDALIDAGMKIANLAIESGSPYIQKYIINKKCNLEKAREVVRYFKSKGIMVRCYFVLGFPGETKEQMLETFEYTKTLQADWCVFNIAVPLVGSEMHEQFLKLGYGVEEIDSWDGAFFQDRKFDTTEISAEELKEYVYRANLICNFIDNINKINGNFERAIEIYNDILEVYQFHIISWYCIMECYKSMGDSKKAGEIRDKIAFLISSDERSAEMYSKYKDLMPGFKFSNSDPRQESGASVE